MTVVLRNEAGAVGSERTVRAGAADEVVRKNVSNIPILDHNFVQAAF
jgi:hypothetical protein